MDSPEQREHSEGPVYSSYAGKAEHPNQGNEQQLYRSDVQQPQPSAGQPTQQAGEHAARGQQPDSTVDPGADKVFPTARQGKEAEVGN